MSLTSTTAGGAVLGGVSEAELPALRALAGQYPTEEAAVMAAAGLRGKLQLARPTAHVISDVHGESAKLRHVINNASGALRPAVEHLRNGSLTAQEQRDLLAVLYYPREVIARLKPDLISSGRRGDWVRHTLELQFDLARDLARAFADGQLKQLIPAHLQELFDELMVPREQRRQEGYLSAMLEEMALHDHDFIAVRAASRLVRNLSAHEIIVAGDLGDRGPRIDRVIDYLMRQPSVKLVWGNHDASWLGACLGNLACIATVLRFSLRYRRLSQLEEGYGITLQPLEKLARDVYGDDPCTHFTAKGDGLRDDAQIARMQKAIAVIQLKCEGKLIEQHAEWNLGGRNLLKQVDWANGTISIDGHTHALLDRKLPTINPHDPNALSAEEQACMDRLRESFVSSARLWEHMSWVVRKGGMWLSRDDVLIFHACVPVDADGQALGLAVDGKEVSGRALFDALAGVVRRAYRHGADGAGDDADWLWYLWCGPRSPLFGKDKITTFEGYFVADKHAKEESKNPYFKLIHDADFARRVGRMFGMNDDVLVVNGHVPVKVEKGETPVKKGGNAVTIDGAFSEAYGDRGYSLLVQPGRITLAEHTHFEGVESAVTGGRDILPILSTVRQYDKPRRIYDTPEGAKIQDDIARLHRLISAMRQGLI